MVLVLAARIILNLFDKTFFYICKHKKKNYEFRITGIVIFTYFSRANIFFFPMFFFISGSTEENQIKPTKSFKTSRLEHGRNRMWVILFLPLCEWQCLASAMEKTIFSNFSLIG